MNEFPFNKEELEITETRKIRRLKLNQVFNSILVAFNLERGGLYTVKQLFANPGKLIENYVGEGRLRYVGPFRLLIITTTIAFILLQYSTTFDEFRAGFYEGIQNPELFSIIESASKYFNILLWLFLPVAALFSWFFNRKRQYNYAENLAFQTYVFSLTNIITMFTIFDKLISPAVIVVIIYAAFTFYYIYSYKAFFKKGWFRSTLEVAVQYTLSSFVYFFFLFGMLFAYYALTQ